MCSNSKYLSSYRKYSPFFLRNFQMPLDRRRRALETKSNRPLLRGFALSQYNLHYGIHPFSHRLSTYGFKKYLQLLKKRWVSLEIVKVMIHLIVPQIKYRSLSLCTIRCYTDFQNDFQAYPMS